VFEDVRDFYQEPESGMECNYSQCAKLLYAFSEATVVLELLLLLVKAYGGVMM